MTSSSSEDIESRLLATRETRVGADNHRAYVGPPELYDLIGAAQFRLLTGLGLREDHRLLDFGCGSLRAGRLFIPYLLPGRYYGIDPNAWLIDEALRLEIGEDMLRLRAPRFDHNDQMRMDVFDTRFDMILAQSVFSHTGADLMLRGFQQAAQVLMPEGQFLFTVMPKGRPWTAPFPDGVTHDGWVYPGCTRFTDPEVADLAAQAGLRAEPLAWFHPTQRWFRAVLPGQPALCAQEHDVLGSGRLLKVPRFPIGFSGGALGDDEK